MTGLSGPLFITLSPFTVKLFSTLTSVLYVVSSNHVYRSNIPSYLRLDVSDNGIGIPEEEQAKIFGRFYRGKQSAGVDGVGIGLYLTRDIVNKQNGYIKVASDEKGTIFSLFLKKV